MTMEDLAAKLIPPVSPSMIHALEAGNANASPATLFDLARIFGSIRLSDELGHEYTLVYRGHIPPILPEHTWPES
jgi:hypothetical protein